MRINPRIIGISLFLGILAGLLDTAIGALVFREGTFLDLALLAVPPERLVFRILALSLFLLFGILVSRHLSRRELKEEEKADRALAESEARFRALAELLPEVVFECDLDFKITYANRRAFELFGYGQEELDAGVSGLDMLVPEDRERVEKSLRGRVQGEDPEVAEYTALRKDGSTFSMLFHATLIREGDRPVGLRGVIVDITERKRTEEELRESESRFRSVVEQLNDATYILFEGRFDLVNPRFCELTGVTPAEVASPDFSFWDLVAPGSVPLIRRRQEQRERGEELPGIYEFEIIHRDGHLVHVEASVTEIDYKGGKAVLGVLRDTTPQKTLKEQLLLAQRMESLGRLSGGVAHDLNNLLTPIMGYADLLRGDLPDSDRNRGSAEEILLAARRAKELVRQLLAFGRRQTMQFQAVDLNQMILGFEGLLRGTVRENVQLRFRLAPSNPAIRGDRGQLEQVVMNLAVNARDAMPEGGVLSIETSEVELDARYARAKSGVTPGPYALMAFSDTGVGMDEATVEKIFEPFFTTKERGEGTGLGLATVYGIIKQHEGNIWAYSEPGVGTTIKCYLPLARGPAVEPAEKSVDLRETGKDGTIMVVEDDDAVRSLAVDLLRRRGYTVLEAADSKGCLEKLGRWSGPLDLLLTDVVMPGMNGRELYLALRERHPGLQVVYMSGYTEDVITHRGVLDEGIYFIQKPFSVRALAARVQSALEED